MASWTLRIIGKIRASYQRSHSVNHIQFPRKGIWYPNYENFNGGPPQGQDLEIFLIFLGSNHGSHKILPNITYLEENIDFDKIYFLKDFI